MQSRSLSTGLLFLVLFSVVLLFAYQHSFNTSLVINSESDYGFKAITDESQGGKTTATLTRTPQGMVLECNIVKAYAWPFCELAIKLSEISEGIDISKYNTVSLDVRYEGEGSQRIRFYIRNFHPTYSDIHNDTTMKVNEIEYEPNLYASEVKIPLKNFQVASWWISEHSIPLEHFAPDFTNVAVLEVATGSLISEGPVKIVVEEIRFDGKLIPETVFLTGIIGIWIAFALIYLLSDLRRLKGDLSSTRQKAVELESLTEALKLESKKFETMAKRDPLTGARNRAGIRDSLFEQVQLVYLQRTPLSIVFMDIDHFKQINDVHGHDIGDEVLKAFAGLVTGQTRQGDSLVRWGGEEFLLVCPNTELNHAAQLAENIRSLLEVSEWPDGVKVTCSFGVTQMGQESTGEFIARADEALYKAKSKGRNRVVSFHPPKE
ncbi:GGDEF domain-containing protein [Motilimonas sp. 1_MG-2023]|uniref:GGDEF domain-containing protein n=1 Tax=Motilimonas TaxID=1914248 RepID=UPI0026E1FD20|nr:GGDEF domain-containing protein [Motilimonas sp. 1_MG-2023]MDO6525700.1 GGDEF domain-containing protein [Motilimonas sp. 1_MG-2023]